MPFSLPSPICVLQMGEAGRGFQMMYNQDYFIRG
jgi:hypothetical protein